MSGRVILATTRRGGVAALREPTGGEGSWEPSDHHPDRTIHALATVPGESNRVIAGGKGGVLVSTDRGETWSPSGLAGETVTGVGIAPADHDRLYAGVRPPGMFRSDDGGETWEPLPAFHSIRGRRLWRSPASPPFTAYVQAIAVSPVDPDTVVAGIEFGAVVRSDDGGRSWSNHRRKALRDCHSLAWHHTDPDVVYEGGVGLRKRPGAISTDRGNTWRRPSGGVDRGYGWGVAADPEYPDVWYVSASTGPSAAHGGREDAKAVIFRRTGDQDWVALGAFPDGAMPYGLWTEPGAPDELWVGTAAGRIWHTADRGETWSGIDGSLPAIERSMVMLAPES